MSDPRRGQGSDPYQPGWPAPTKPVGSSNPGSPDPAYAGQFSYPSYTPPPGPHDTQQLPPYWTQTQYRTPEQHAAPPPPPEPSGTPRWLWLLAGAAVLLVIGLVIALVIANGSARQDTVLSPAPSATEPSARSTAPTTTARPTTTRAPSPTRTTTAPGVPPTEPPATAGEQTVLYSVSGEGRAMNITYADTGGVMQMEFNVPLPWSKEVTMASAADKANVSVLKIGSEVTCTVSVDGTLLREKTGNGLTICSPLG